MKQPYNVKIVVYCDSDTEAKSVQNAVSEITAETHLIGSDLLRFHAKYKQNETVIKPILKDVFSGGISKIAKHIPKLLTIR